MRSRVVNPRARDNPDRGTRLPGNAWKLVARLRGKRESKRRKERERVCVCVVCVCVHVHGDDKQGEMRMRRY